MVWLLDMLTSEAEMELSKGFIWLGGPTTINYANFEIVSTESAATVATHNLPHGK